jgi:hypothetical protein
LRAKIVFAAISALPKYTNMNGKRTDGTQQGKMSQHVAIIVQ